jgi:hypothetical protein
MYVLLHESQLRRGRLKGCRRRLNELASQPEVVVFNPDAATNESLVGAPRNRVQGLISAFALGRMLRPFLRALIGAY